MIENKEPQSRNVLESTIWMLAGWLTKDVHIEKPSIHDVARCLCMNIQIYCEKD